MAQSKDPSPRYGIDETFNRPAAAPTTPEVANWPTQKELGWPSLSQADKSDIAANKYMNNEVHKMASKYVEPEGQEWKRSAKAPTKAEVANWPLSYSQQGKADADIARNEHVNPDTFHLANPHVPEKSEIPRAAAPPKSAEVANWPFPQYAQSEGIDFDKERKDMVIEPTFNDAHFHSPKHVWERNAPEPKITSPPADTPAEKAAALKAAKLASKGKALA